MTSPEEILIDRSPGETRAVVISDGIVIDLAIERPSSMSRVGEIVLARATSVRDRGRIAFLDIGNESALLEGAGIVEGAAVLVQVTRDRKGDKAPKAGTAIDLQGRYMVLTPTRPGISLSSRITNKAERKRIRGGLEDVVTDDLGVVARSLARGVDSEVLRREADELIGLWLRIKQDVEAAVPPAVLLRSPGPIAALLDRYPDTLVTESRDGVLLAERGIVDEIETLLSSKVNIPGGGELVIERTEALVAIDINTAEGFADGSGLLEFNLRAAREVVRQICLRGLSGLIVVDFPRLARPSDREQVLEQIRSSLVEDPWGSITHGWTRAGLFEITRRRVQAGPAETMLRQPGEPGPSAETLAYEALRYALRETVGIARPRLVVAPGVAAFLKGPGAEALTETNRRLGGSLALEGRSGYERTRMEIEDEGRDG
jgi:ribonuclease G